MEETVKHPNSRIVTLRRNENFLSKAQGEGIKDFLTSAIQGIGSYFEGKGSTKIASGLTVSEEKLLIPELIGVDSLDRGYIDMRTKFFANFETKVPNNGTPLEIGLTLDNNKPLSVDNLPLQLMDYLRYRHSIKHPWTAISLAAAKGNQMKHFYVDDPVTSTAVASTTASDQDRAMTYYLSIKDNPSKVEMALTLAEMEYRDIVGQTSDQTVQLRQQAFRNLVTARTSKVLEIMEDKNFEIKYNINMMLNTGVLKRAGTSILDPETEKTIGNMDATIEFFKDVETNSQTITILKGKLQEALKANKRPKAVKEVARRNNR